MQMVESFVEKDLLIVAFRPTIRAAELKTGVDDCARFAKAEQMREEAAREAERRTAANEALWQWRLMGAENRATAAMRTVSEMRAQAQALQVSNVGRQLKFARDQTQILQLQAELTAAHGLAAAAKEEANQRSIEANHAAEREAEAQRQLEAIGGLEPDPKRDEADAELKEAAAKAGMKAAAAKMAEEAAAKAAEEAAAAKAAEEAAAKAAEGAAAAKASEEAAKREAAKKEKLESQQNERYQALRSLERIIRTVSDPNLRKEVPEEESLGFFKIVGDCMRRAPLNLPVQTLGCCALAAMAAQLTDDCTSEKVSSCNIDRPSTMMLPNRGCTVAAHPPAFHLETDMAHESCSCVGHLQITSLLIAIAHYLL